MNISENLVIRNIKEDDGEKTMIINMSNGNVTLLDEIGSYFWKAVSTDDFQSVMEEMCDAYDVSGETLLSDYNTFCDKMKELELIW